MSVHSPAGAVGKRLAAHRSVVLWRTRAEASGSGCREGRSVASSESPQKRVASILVARTFVEFPFQLFFEHFELFLLHGQPLAALVELRGEADLGRVVVVMGVGDLVVGRKDF